MMATVVAKPERVNEHDLEWKHDPLRPVACAPAPDATWAERKRIIDLFFAPDNTQAGLDLQAEAKAMCRVCPAQLDCLEYALEVGEHEGVWGGYNQRELKRLRRYRRDNAAASRVA